MERVTTDAYIEGSYSNVKIQHHTKILSDEGRLIFEGVNFGIICGLFSLIGITTNGINAIVFYKQGFTNTVNIAFLGLAISDTCCLIALEWASMCMNPLIAAIGVPWVRVEVMYLSASWPHVCFCRITSYITVYITAERFLCISLPLKVKQLVTAKRTTLIIVGIYFVNLMTIVPEYATSYLGWRFVPESNTSLVAVIFTSSRKNLEGIIFIFHFFLTTTAFLGVIIFTLLLVLKLKQSSEWRKVATSNNDQRVSSTRDKKTVKMIVLIATILIICYTPGAVLSMASFIVGPEFNIRGRFINVCSSAWSFAYVFQSINSSVNIVLYYRMSSRYRQVLTDIVCSKRLNVK